jgi:iodotyrosine deiodinase
MHDDEPRFVPYEAYREYPAEQMQARVEAFEQDLQRRRTVRQFSDRPAPRAVIERCLLAAGTAPSGAHQQPWHFVAIADPGTHTDRRGK